MDAKVPQRIDMEDRVIGPLTLQQFSYLLFGGLSIYLLNSWTADTAIRIFFYPAAIIIGVLAFSLAFVKVQERPFIFFIGAAIRYLQRPRQRVWMKGQHGQLVQIVEKAKETAKTVPHKDFNRQRVTDLVKVLDTGQEGNGQS